jgi:cephalosporin-C deacetylase-like acetyl esterase
MRFVFIVFAFLVSSIAMAGANEKQTKTIAGYVSDEPGFQRELKGAKFKFACDRSNATYKVGEVAKITISPIAADGTILTGELVKVSLDNFGEHKIVPQFSATAGIDGFIKTEGTLITPGFLRVKASMGEGKTKVAASWSVAYEPEKIVPGTDDVDDFDAFWSDAKEKLEKETPLDMKCSKVEELSKGDKDFYVFEFSSYGGRRMNGSLTIPKKLKPPYPVRIRLPGAGCGVGANRITDLMPYDDALCMMVYPFDWPQAITGSLDKVLAKYDAFWGDSVKKYGVPWYCAGISESKEEFFYYSVILGANRAINWLRSDDCCFEVDKNDFVYAGASQGGGLGLAILYLNDSFRKAVINVTGLSDIKGFLHQARQGGWPAIIQAHHPKYRAAVSDRIRYFDGVNFARRLKVPVWFTAGYADTACPPAGVWATYNVCTSKEKHISGMVGCGHAVEKDVEKVIEEWLHKK